MERVSEDEVLIIATDGLWDVFTCKVCMLREAYFEAAVFACYAHVNLQPAVTILLDDGH